MDPASFDFAEVSEQGGKQLVRPADKAARSREQLGVGESIEGIVRGETGRGVHNLHHNPMILGLLTGVLRGDRGYERVSKRPRQRKLRERTDACRQGAVLARAAKIV